MSTLSEHIKRYHELERNFKSISFGTNIDEKYRVALNLSNPPIDKIVNTRLKEYKKKLCYCTNVSSRLKKMIKKALMRETISCLIWIYKYG